MARYIDADALILEISSLSITLGGKELLGEITKNSVIRMVNEQPTADVVPRSEWISVEDRLPDREGKYLVYTTKGAIKFGEYRSYLVGEGKLCEPQFDYYVTHWMPLPEPPKMKG